MCGTGCWSIAAISASCAATAMMNPFDAALGDQLAVDRGRRRVVGDFRDECHVAESSARRTAPRIVVA